MSETRSSDRQEILGHIDRIFRAYLARDRETIRRLHAPDWVGFQAPSAKIERGIEDYMKNADASLDALRGTGYELLDTEVQFHGDVALVYYVARYDCVNGEGKAISLPLRSIDVYRRDREEWNQIGSHIGVIPAARGWGA